MDSAQQRTTVLVADDDPDTADSLSSLLETATAPVRAIAVYDGMQAVLAAHAEPFDVVLLDIQMPSLDGIAAGQAIRRLRPRSKLILVAMSGSSEKVRLAQDSAVFDLVLQKPVNPASLMSTLFPAQ